MISAILLAWAPTSAYAGFSDFTVLAIDRKGNSLIDGCGEIIDVFSIVIRGKGEYKLDALDAVPIPKGTGTIKVTYSEANIIDIEFQKNNGSVISNTGPTGAQEIRIDANIATKVLCGLDIPRGTVVLIITSGTD